MMESKAKAWIAQHSLLARGDKVVVALSGGADSVALFHFLLHNAEEWGIAGLFAAHMNHGLRGEEADSDAAFVRQLCEQCGVPLFEKKAHMAENRQAKPPRTGTEAWARRLRYEWFEELAGQNNAKIATAHTLSDNAETLLFRAARGTGPRGIGGIPVRRGPFIRPLLGASRAEVEAYCGRHGLPYVTDSTNLDPHYAARNQLRAQVLPALKQLNPAAEAALGRLAGDMIAVNAWLEEQAQLLLRQAAAAEQEDAPAAFCPDAGGAWDAGLLLAAPAPVRLAALALLAGPRADRAALALLEGLLAGQPRALALPGGRRAVLQRGQLRVGRQAAAAPAEDYELPLAEGKICLPGGYALRATIGPMAPFCQEFAKSAQKGLTFYADYDKIIKHAPGALWRSRRPQDVFSPPGRGLSKPLRKWMNEQRIDPALRGSLPLLAAGSHVLWVWAWGFAEGLAPAPESARILQLKILPNRGGPAHDAQLV